MRNGRKQNHLVSLKKNVVANYLGQGWAAMMGLVFIPVYIGYLGVEAWGLVGFMAMMQAWFVLFDMGLTPALSREMARFGAGAHSPQSILDLLRSLEIAYAGIAVIVIVLVWLTAPWIASEWLMSARLSPNTVSQAIAIMGFVLAARMVEQVYRGAIQGLQHQVWLNLVQGVLATLRWGGGIGVLAWIAPTIEAFFLWQGFVSLLTVALLAFQTYRWLPASEIPARFNVVKLMEISRYAGGSAAAMLLGVLLSQMDKLLLSKLVPLEQFGYYALAASVAGVLYFFMTSITTAAAPRLTELATRADHSGFVSTYHWASQWSAVTLIPPALVLAAFTEPLLWAWGGDAVLVERVAPVLALLALGTMFSGFVRVPFTAQRAFGRTGFAVRANLIAVILIAPAIFWVAPRYGGIGVAWVWFALNVGYVFFGMHFLYRRMLPTEKWRWYRDAIVQPLLAGAAAIVLLKLTYPAPSSRAFAAIMIVIAAVVTFGAVLAATPEPRTYLLRQIARLRGKHRA